MPDDAAKAGRAESVSGTEGEGADRGGVEGADDKVVAGVCCHDSVSTGIKYNDPGTSWETTYTEIARTLTRGAKPRSRRAHVTVKNVC